MESSEHKAVGCELAFNEARRWMEEVTKKMSESSNFRSALENGVLLCDLINHLKPGIIKRLNRLSTPIAGLDNINVFLKACKKLGLNDAQLFHPGDLQDVSTRVTVRHQETSRRLKNVLITIYWLGRKAYADPSYKGPQLNFKAFEGLLGVPLSKALEEASCSKSSVRDSGFAETWYPDREVPSYRREDSVESLDSVGSHTLSAASDCTLKAGSEGFGSDAEAELCFRMSEPLSAPSKERGNIPAALRRKRFEQQEKVGSGLVGPLYRLPAGGDPCAGSKSMSDLKLEPGTQEAESITALYLLKSRRNKAATVSLRQDRIRQYQARLRESEAKWEEDLNRWKTRRRSVTSDLNKKQEEGQQLEPISFGNVHVGEQQKQCGSSTACPLISTGPAPARRGCSHADGPIQPIPHTLSVGSAVSDQVQNILPFSFPDSRTALVSDSAPVPLQRAKSLEGVLSGTPQMSAVLPRGFRRSEGTSRLSTGVTPRPFSSKTPRLSAQARFYSVDETNNIPQVLHQLPASVLPQETDAAPGYKDVASFNKHAAVLQKKTDKEKVMEKRKDSAPSIHSFMSASVLVSKTVSVSNKDEVDHRDMRVSLNQTPGSGKDFGFLSYWDSTGARIKSVTAGSAAQLCHLQAGDEIVALAGQRVAEMSYEQWKANMDAALREGKLLMDIRRISLNGDTDDHTSVSSTSSLTGESESKVQLNGHPVNTFPFRVTKASDNSVPTKPKGSSASLVDSSVYLCGGSQSAILDLHVPSISASSSRLSWNPVEERRRQEKWQIEQEHLLQEKYRRDQERLEEAWKRAQQEAAFEKNSDPGVSQQLEQSPISVGPTQPAQEGTLDHSKQVQIAASHPPEDWCNSSLMTSQWQSECYGFTKLNASDRKKSKSTPTLDGSHKQDPKASIKKKGRLSQAEQERLQILEEMRKKTPVLTDSSWIRQRSTCTIHKEPIDVAPLRRHESLDNVHSSISSSVSRVSLSKQFSGSSQILSGLSGIVPYKGYSGRCSLGPGAAIFSSTLRQSSWTRPNFSSPVSDTEEACNRAQQQNSASAAGLRSGQTQSLELRCESDTDNSSVTPVTTDSESVPAFPNDLKASRQIREEPFSEDDSDTAAT